MNFFEHQDRARSSTRKLVLLFALALASLILATVLLVVAVLSFGNEDPQQGFSFDWSLVSSEMFLIAGVGVVSVVVLGSLFRTAQLRGGGKAVAEALGGRLLNVGTLDADERKILNVVEEMAIATGLPVPPVYLLEDSAINAFAAGYSKEDAVIGITRGCIQLLNRDELQGVIAHEFSHVFNGDMRLNIRLMGWLYGILVIGMIGYFMLRGGRYGMVAQRGRNNRGGGGLVVLALGLVVIGYGGTFFGNVIKAAVSRQREFLADASAVQYTRNPDGIGGALKKIAASSQGSLLRSTDASEVSHMLFGQGIKAGFTGLLSTHPPLEERIKRVQPHWDGSLQPLVAKEPQASAAAKAATAGPAAAMEGLAAGPAGAAMGMPALVYALVAAVGEPSAESLQRAQQQLAALPDTLKADAHTTLGATLLVHALLMQGSAAPLREQQRSRLQSRLSAASLQRLDELVEALEPLPRNLHLVLLDLALPALKQLSEEQCRAFLHDMAALMRTDQQTSLFEWCVYRIVQQHLVRQPLPRGTLTLAECAEACEILLSVLVHAGHAQEDEARQAFAAAVASFAELQTLALHPPSDGLGDLERALARLQRLQPLQKPQLLKAMVYASCHDGQLLPQEQELLRAVATILDCPLPPLPDFSSPMSTSAPA